MEEDIAKNWAKIVANASIDGVTYDLFARIKHAELQLCNAHYTEKEAKEFVYHRACSAIRDLEVNLLKHYSEEEN